MAHVPSIDVDELPTDRVIICLSNVTREKTLGFGAHEAALERWDRLRSAWVTRFGEPPEGFRWSLTSHCSAGWPRRRASVGSDGGQS